jgi:plasmid stabilization system protein ParE
VKAFAFHPEARAELLDAKTYYDAESPDLGDRFAASVESMVAEVCRAPQRYRFVRRPVRRHFERPFPYALLYVDEPEIVLILAVAHFKRRPGYWLHRLRKP